MWKLRAPCWGSLTASTFPYVTASGWGLRWAFPPSTKSIPIGCCRQGVYVTRVLLDGVWRPSATGLGTRPTVNGDGVTCETFIPDFSGDIYGDRVPVRFCRFLWPTQKFGTLEELSAMVGRAAQAAREWREK